MGIIKVETPKGIVQVEIEGDTPTQQESELIEQQFFGASTPFLPERTFKDLMAETKKASEDEGFDYETGAPSGIRALVSFGETAEEQEAILLKNVGQGGYTKDSRGRLAITPEGQRTLGLEPSEKNIILEDEGFSAGDFADLAGILPESIGSVVGAIIGSPGVVTGAAGAAAGAATGQALEEGIESILGIQKQTLPEVGKDIAGEALLAGTVDLVGMGVFRAGKAIIGGASSRMAGDAADATRGARLVDEGYMPSLERLGAPTAIGYSQKFAEGATRDTTRVMNNTGVALAKRDEMLQNLATLEEAGGAFADATSASYKLLDDTVKEAQEASMQAVKDSVRLLERGADAGVDINNEVLGEITKAFSAFQDVSTGQFRLMDDMLGRLSFTDAVEGVVKEGGKARIIPTSGVKGTTEQLESAIGSLRMLDDDVRKTIMGIRSLDEYASFEQMANQRKFINDLIFSGRELTRTQTDQLFKLRDAFDSALDSVNLNQIKGLAPGQNSQLRAIANQRERAINQYRDGMKRFEDVEKFGVVRSIKAASKDPRFNADQFFQKVIRKNSPERLKAVLNAVDDKEYVRSALAKSYLDDALSRTSIDLMNPNQFNGVAFRNQINALGTTGKELFGNQWGQVKKLADTIAQVGPARMPQEAVDNIIKIGADKPIMDSVKKLAEARRAFDEANRIKVVREFNEGVLNPEDAAQYITRPGTNLSEVGRIQNFFKSDPEALQTIKESVMRDLLSSVGNDVFTSPASAATLKKHMDSYREGVLEKILGKESYNMLDEFAKDMIYLGDVGKEGSIYAATFAAHPIAKARDNLRMKTTAKVFSSPKVLAMYAKKGQGTPNQRVGGIMNSVGNAMNVMGAVRQFGAQALAEQVGQTGEEVKRQILPPTPQAPNPNISSSLAAASPIDQGIGASQYYGIPQQASQPSIRQQAAANPALAEALGIRGATAGLLNR
jgi:hypothetical protein